jgi:hypothetical protein
MEKEVRRVEGFGAWTIVPYREYREMSRKYHSPRPHVQG